MSEGKAMTGNPEQLLKHAERVRQAYLAERKLRGLAAKLAAGHQQLQPFAARMAAQLDAIVRSV
jgi:hypothetical protein